MINPSNPLYREVNIDIDAKALKEAINFTDIGEGSYLKPMPLDPFLVDKIDSFFNIEEGNGFAVNINFKDQDLSPKCHYLRFRNRNKHQDHIMTKEGWAQCFEIEGNPHITYAPDGSLFLEPNPTSSGASFAILSKISADPTSSKDNYLSYAILVSFKFDGKTYYFVFDPIVKVSSKHG